MVYAARAREATAGYFEVDSTESVWYNAGGSDRRPAVILKLTPQSQYGIRSTRLIDYDSAF